jgi:FMN-dependent NADH-azoreductase
MKKLLVIDCSPKGELSASRKISQKLMEKFKSLHPTLEIIHRDLTQAPPPHLNPKMVQAFFTPAAQRSHDQKKLIALSDQLTQELIQADAVIVSSPMWNFSVPSALKAWIDHIVRAGLSFQYTDKGPEGLLDPKKKVFLALSTGGIYSHGPAQNVDHLAPYLQSVFEFLGIKEIHILRAEGTAYPNGEATALAKAFADIESLKV